MQAVQYISSGQVSLVNIPEPEVQPGQVLIRMERAAICGSDLHALYDMAPTDYPLKPGMTGHECIGIIEEAADSGFKRGDRVLIIPPGADAFAERFAVEPGRLILIPDHLNSSHAVLAQQMGTVIYCCRKLSNVLDKSVVVVGQGPVGLFFGALLYRMGAKRVIGLDIVDHRLAVSEKLGLIPVNPLKTDPVLAVKDLTEGRMADVVVEAVGKEETIDLVSDLARDEAELALFGVPKRSVFPFAYEKFFRRQLRTVTSAHTQSEPGLRSFRLALDMIAQGRIDVAPWISHVLPFSDAKRGFWLAQSKEDRAVKVLLDFTI